MEKSVMAGREHNIVSVSGGKDSTAMLLLAIERKTENLQAVFADTGHEHQMTYEYIQYLSDKIIPIRTVKADFTRAIEGKRKTVETKWREEGISEDKIGRALEVLKPTGIPFLDGCIAHGRFPGAMVRWCSDELKTQPVYYQVLEPLLNAGDDVVEWHGVRADESRKRSCLTEREFKKAYDTGAERWIYRPILSWTAEQCFEMHKKHGIDPNPLYKLGMSRVGCMPCIHVRKSELNEISNRFPEEIERVSDWEKIVKQASKQDKGCFAVVDGCFGIKKTCEWAKTTRGNKNFDMFSGDAPSCSSVYGLCE